MSKPWTTRAAGAAALLLVASGLGALSAASATATPGHGAGGRLHAVRVCTATLGTGEANCHAKVLVDSKGAYPASTSPPASGLDPAELKEAYKLTGLTSGGRTVAIVDAFGYPNLERDLATYRSQFGLPPCTRANGCLRIIDQTGGTALPRLDVGWAQEQALDVDAVSAACPDCKILVVQARTNSFANLGAAVVTASNQPGVVAISNSYGGGDAADATYGAYYNHPGIAVTASTGDSGYRGGSYPASSSYVTAVGGTSLVKDSSARGWSESVWSGAGSGCSSYNAALAAASTFDTGCTRRAMADVAAAADPGKGGLAVYYPTSRNGSTWGQFGGTSESAPIIAAVYALSGNTAGYANAIPYSHAGNLFDVTSGSNGSCPTTQWCTARTGWDGPTGLGTPNGAGAF
ncbi:subtilase family serine protease [Nocardioides ginsengisegetis]|uniref:Subtilase family serine protease n=1 Tax=Nocardioides ginsengisegetis TaxID=661491 RepID=A0A7W3IY04_9ACTN|nr:peptidase S8 [Nocardioides ginsengisegetis]MBA8802696.1 subtilase family serine protease [Nocardioides ginsengisegetis]